MSHHPTCIALLFIWACVLIGSDGNTFVYLPESVPNLDAAMEGFDPLMFDPLESPNPGIRGQIFAPRLGSEYIQNRIHSFVDKARKDVHCNMEFTSKTFRNLNQYRHGKSSRFLFVSEIHGNDKVLTSNTMSEGGYKMLRFFQETRGVIVEIKAECITHSLGISLFEKPVFTPAFLTALMALDKAAKFPESQRSNKTFRNFVRSYGTHFMRQTLLGSDMVFERRIPRKLRMSDADLQHCLTVAAQRSVQTTMSNFSMLSQNCVRERNNEHSSYFQADTVSESAVISTGLAPKPNTSWAETVNESPVPIRYELENIYELFTEPWFDSDITNSGETNQGAMNGTQMALFFKEQLSEYCPTVFGRNCYVEENGCGVNSLCPADETCVNDLDSTLGYYCGEYGAIYIAGGVGDENGTMQDAETLDAFVPHATLFPKNIGNSLTILGGVIYYFGRTVDDWRQNVFLISDYSGHREPSSCSGTSDYRYDLFAFHSAVPMQSSIWFLYESELYVHHIRRNYDGPRCEKYHLPFSFGKNICAVSNTTHSYVIGVGESKNEVWLNKKALIAAEWSRVATLTQGREKHACLWFATKIFVTGGSTNNITNNNVEVIDVGDHSVRTVGGLSQTRHGHKMAVLDNMAAVLGGGNDSGEIFDSIETYDSKSDTWAHTRSLRNKRIWFGLAQIRS